jgi:hypothetical protein
MQRMTDALSRMLNDPTTRSAMRSAQANEANEPQEEEERTEPANVVQQVLTIRIYFILIKVNL